MSRRTRFPVDEVTAFPEPDPRILPGSADFEISVRNVGAWGADVPRYRAAVAAGLGAATTRRIPVTLADVATVAAWRAGVPQIRSDALARIIRSVEMNAHSSLIFAATLGFAPEMMSAFLSAQRVDPFGWPQPLPVLAAFGGYRGIGGRFRTAPVGISAEAGSASWYVAGDGECWRVQADIFGAALTPCERPADQEWSSRIPLSGNAVATVFPTSYLVWVLPRSAP
ncbi:hypothetical protein [Gordonia insulae]|uniref:Uncharacterized protein n=1 Tax=Gordonia insulae TaxID=2420509 RepID=A0A3G8JMZ0_9ACTN|nr:hypothetical protein [Gordonia insulae]AZG46456.1 hypothetical protein D7316_03057 [Gordonia insulae]